MGTVLQGVDFFALGAGSKFGDLSGEWPEKGLSGLRMPFSGAALVHNSKGRQIPPVRSLEVVKI